MSVDSEINTRNIAIKLSEEHRQKFEILLKIAGDSCQKAKSKSEEEYWFLLFVQFEKVINDATLTINQLRETKANVGQGMKMLPKPIHVPSIKVTQLEEKRGTEIAIRPTQTPALVKVITSKPWPVKQMEKTLSFATKLITWKKKT